MLSNVDFINEKNQMLENVGKMCKIVRNGNLEWENGVIIGVMSDKRSNCNMFRIECLKDKKVVNKKRDSNLFKLLDVRCGFREVKSRKQSIDTLSRGEILKKIELLNSEIEVLKNKLAEL